MDCFRRRSQKALLELNLAAENKRKHGAGTAAVGVKGSGDIRSSLKRGRQHVRKAPELPPTEIKVVMRPKNNLDLNKTREATLFDSICSRAGIPRENAAEETLRINPPRNVLLGPNTSAICIKNVTKYASVVDSMGIGSTCVPNPVATCRDSVSRVIRVTLDRDVPVILGAPYVVKDTKQETESANRNIALPT
ncbi:hypothetical protein HPB48_009897 [Haemaphysalis longicornis]|uniref:Uncharacterized protein n=1 Tax=Haemaphysalis longicornis TaxID=44386 RepID=A0A9J6GIR0_HAELO|nr:hypothetical protein HPB48_009897 [Haemaphysalis longicornis]